MEKFSRTGLRSDILVFGITGVCGRFLPDLSPTQYPILHRQRRLSSHPKVHHFLQWLQGSNQQQQ
jgi:hypothetical protein